MPSIPINLIAFNDAETVDILFTRDITNRKELRKLVKDLSDAEGNNIFDITGVKCSPEVWEEYLKRKATQQEIQSWNQALKHAKELYEKNQKTETFQFKNSEEANIKLTEAFTAVLFDAFVNAFVRELRWVNNKLRIILVCEDQTRIDASFEIYKVHIQNSKEVRIIIHTEAEATIPVDLKLIAEKLSSEVKSTC